MVYPRFDPSDFHAREAQTQASPLTAAWRQHWDFGLIMLLGAAMFFLNLGSPLLEPDEARYAEIPRLMVRSGDWITPRLQGKPYNDKPPLVYWLIAASYSAFGVSIESARLVPASAGWLTLLIVYLWSRRYLDRRTACFAGLILLSMIGYVALMRMLLLDGVLTFLVVAALLSGHHALAKDRHPAWWLVSAFLCGLAVLAKGPVALVLIAPCLFALRWLDRSLPPARMLDGLWYGVVVTALAAPWYVTMLGTNESFGSEHFLRHHIRRFLDPAHHERPFWYYAPALFLELMPWPFLALAVWTRWRKWTGPERLLAFFSVWTFAFFTLAQAKLPTYTLPILPLFAVLIARQWRVRHRRASSHALQTGLVLTCLAAMHLILAMRGWGYHWVLDDHPVSIDPWPLAVLAVVGAILAFTALPAGMVKALPGARPGFPTLRRLWKPITLASALFVVFWSTHIGVVEYAENASLVQDCLRMAHRAQSESIPFAAHRNSWDAVSFALNGDELQVFSSREWEHFIQWLTRHPRCMIWMRDYERRTESFLKQLPSTLEVEQLYDFGKLQVLILRNRQPLQTTGLTHSSER